MAARTAPYFSLVPVNKEAIWVVDQPENREHWALSRDERGSQPQYFKFLLNRRSKTAGRLVTFGRHEQNDVRLPGRAPSGAGSAAPFVAARPELKRGRSYQNYHNHHCFFFLAPSGELILRDLSPCLVHIELKDATPDEAVLYALHGSPERGPRQRVIPRTSRGVYITIGSSTLFRLLWSSEVAKDGLNVQTYMAGRARSLAVPGMTLTPPGSASMEPPGLHSRELRSRYTPSSASQSGPHRPIHKYAKLGSGGFGAVYKAVDLRTGQLWAVKEIAPPRRGPNAKPADGLVDKLKESLIMEVDNMAKISHPRIVHYETYQDFRINGSFQIFYKLYEGSLVKLIQGSHSCKSPLPSKSAPWMPKLVTQMSEALEYLHRNGILHLDIKPDNILFDRVPGGAEPNFYLGDFGLAKADAEISGCETIGTPFYMAPEIDLGLWSPCTASDIWSFAMTIGEALGFWCPDEVSLNAQEWVSKIQVLGGSKVAYSEGSDLMRYAEEKVLYRRIASLVTTGALPPMFSEMFQDIEDRPTALQCMHTPAKFFIERPANPQPLKDWPGNKTPWVVHPNSSVGSASSSSQSGLLVFPKPAGPPAAVAPARPPQPQQQNQLQREQQNLQRLLAPDQLFQQNLQQAMQQQQQQQQLMQYQRMMQQQQVMLQQRVQLPMGMMQVPMMQQQPHLQRPHEQQKQQHQEQKPIQEQLQRQQHEKGQALQQREQALRQLGTAIRNRAPPRQPEQAPAAPDRKMDWEPTPPSKKHSSTTAGPKPLLQVSSSVGSPSGPLAPCPGQNGPARGPTPQQQQHQQPQQQQKSQHSQTQQQQQQPPRQSTDPNHNSTTTTILGVPVRRSLLGVPKPNLNNNPPNPNPNPNPNSNPMPAPLQKGSRLPKPSQGQGQTSIAAAASAAAPTSRPAQQPSSTGGNSRLPHPGSNNINNNNNSQENYITIGIAAQEPNGRFLPQQQQQRRPVFSAPGRMPNGGGGAAGGGGSVGGVAGAGAGAGAGGGQGHASLPRAVGMPVAMDLD